jgi:hypothetical protein
MRPPVVKRQKIPLSGIFSTCGADDAGVRGCELTSLPGAGAAETCRHHTRIEALSPSRGRWQRDPGAVSCGLETSECPHTVRGKGVAKRRSFASECRARGRGSTRPSAPASPQASAPERASNQPQGSGSRAYARMRVPRRRGGATEERGLQADPHGVQFGVRLAHSTPDSPRNWSSSKAASRFTRS